MIKVLIADDHKMFRQGLRMLFEMESDIKVVGEARDGLEVQELAVALEPDIILMDINMPGTDGVEATRQVLKRRPEQAVIILTMFREDEHVYQAINAGARGYVLKDADSVDVLRALRSVADGGSVLDAAMTNKVFQQFKQMSEKSEKHNPEGLTNRELEILALIANGDSNRVIGEKLFLSEKTIKNYITSIFQKLQTSDRTHAAVYAIQHGLIGQPVN
ncbi:MAG TPA: response regulator transcription factor [Chloroflexia bacterium]|nr:response regulator transcription factor [Chloroflexia bacterium]HYP21268.1 response regulator transcription factor [Chloroflexia bacterium]